MNEQKKPTDRVSTWDGWRGLAISLVLIGHFIGFSWIWEDRLGVDIFFVLSGMLMSTILFEKRLSLKDFYIRRFSRIYPILLVYVIVVFAFTGLVSKQFAVEEFFSSLLFLRTYYPIEPNIWSSEVSIGHLWSLNVEEHAYVFLSLVSLLLVSRRYVAYLLLALGVTSIAISLYHYITLTSEEFALYSLRTESAIVFIFFSAGYGLLKRKLVWTLPPYSAPLCFTGALFCYVTSMPIWMVFTISPVLLSIAVNHLDELPKILSKCLSFRPLRYLGICSYSIYLWQQFFFDYGWKFFDWKPGAGIIAIVVGVLSFHLVENPIRHYINNRWSKTPAYRH